MSKEFRFQVFPSEDLVGRETRWDKELAELQSQGLTIQGAGPDGDYPIRYDFAADGSMTFDEWWKGNPDTPWFEVYNLVPLKKRIDHWGYRATVETVDGEDEYAVREVHFYEDGTVAGWSEPPTAAVGDTIEEVRVVLARMLADVTAQQAAVRIDETEAQSA